MKKYIHGLSRATDVDPAACRLIQMMVDELFPEPRKEFTVTGVTQTRGMPQRHETVYVTGRCDKTGMRVVVQPSDNGTAIVVVVRCNNEADQGMFWRPAVQKLARFKGVWKPVASHHEEAPADTGSASPFKRIKSLDLWQQFLSEVPEYLGFGFFGTTEAQENLGVSFGLAESETADILRLAKEAGYLETKDCEFRLTEVGARRAKAIKGPQPQPERAAELIRSIEETDSTLRQLRSELAYRQ